MLENQKRRLYGDGGVTMVLVGLTLVVLMIFAAIVVDLGAVYVERREDQGGVDAAALSGAVQLSIDQGLQGAVDEVVAKVNADLDPDISVAAWTACTDSGALARTAATLSTISGPKTQCISFDAGFTRMRVRIPDQTIITMFGRVVGINSFKTTAAAEVRFMEQGAGTLPFVALSTASSGSQVCLRTGDNGKSQPPPPLTGVGPSMPPVAVVADDPSTPFFDESKDPCDSTNMSASAANKGDLRPYFYQPACTKPSGNDTTAAAIVVGMDHPLGIFSPAFTYDNPPTPPDEVKDYEDNRQALVGDVRLDGSAGCATALPNTVEVNEGLGSYIGCALIGDDVSGGSCTNGAVTGEGRLRRGDFVQNLITFANNEFDNKPLWDFFVDPLPAAAPASCKALKANLTNASWGFYYKRDTLIECLLQWTQSAGQIFTEDIGKTTRFGYVPQIAERSLCKDQSDDPVTCTQQTKTAHVNTFVAVYLDQLYQENGKKCDNVTPDPRVHDWAIYAPGQPVDSDPGAGVDTNCGKFDEDIDRMSALVVPCGSLPSTMCDPTGTPPVPGLGTNTIFDIRLVK